MEERKIFFFDIDETIFKTFAKIIVKNKHTNEIVKKLDNQEFNGYSLKNEETYDFSEFKCPEIFIKSEPIEKTIDRLKKIQSNKNNEIFLLTARGDFNKPKILIEYLQSFGLNIGHKKNKGEIHILRTGDYSIANKLSTEEAKFKFVKDIILEKKEIKKQHIYLFDDYVNNVEKMIKIANDKETCKYNIQIKYKGELIHEGETVKEFIDNNNKHIQNIKDRKFIKKEFKNKTNVLIISAFLKKIAHRKLDLELEKEIKENLVKLNSADRLVIMDLIQRNKENYLKPSIELDTNKQLSYS